MLSVCQIVVAGLSDYCCWLVAATYRDPEKAQGVHQYTHSVGCQISDIELYDTDKQKQYRQDSTLDTSKLSFSLMPRGSGQNTFDKIYIYISKVRYFDTANNIFQTDMQYRKNIPGTVLAFARNSRCWLFCSCRQLCALVGMMVKDPTVLRSLVEGYFGCRTGYGDSAGTEPLLFGAVLQSHPTVGVHQRFLSPSH